jgi:prepilin-type N-terminal cleavage/methylation domain-containing protein
MKMGNKKRHTGFSLVEVLMAIGILTIGLLLVATMFPAAIYMTSIASERTMAAIVADEAFAKIQLYGIITNTDPCSCTDWGDEMKAQIDANEFSYPPVDSNGSSQYFWSAIYRKTDKNPDSAEYQITVFVARRMNSGLTYESGKAAAHSGGKTWPMPIEVAANGINGNTIKIPADAKLVNPSTTIVDNETGRLYSVVKRGEDNDATKITLDRKWEGTISTVWLIPPPESGGKNAGVEVYQRIIKF